MPFSADEFFAVLGAYNQAVWPAQYFLFALACFAVYFAALPSRAYDRIATAVLAFLWVWVALAYHLAFFTRINHAAPIFALAFLVQAAALWRFGIARGTLTLQLRNTPAGWMGSLAIVYALIVYPVLTMLSGHFYPDMPTFGLPCPTTIFTFGLLLWAQPAVPYALLVVPVLWALVGTVAAASLGMPPDYALSAVAAAAVVIALAQRRPAAGLA